MVEITARNMISNSNSLQALLWGCGIGTILTLFLVVGFRVLTFKKSLESWNAGTMVFSGNYRVNKNIVGIVSGHCVDFCMGYGYCHRRFTCS